MRQRYAIVVPGGAGDEIEPKRPEEQASYLRSLHECCAVAHEVHSLVKYTNCTVQEAADRLIHQVLQEGDGGLIAVDREGNPATPFNTPQVWRGVADSDGRFEVSLD